MRMYLVTRKILRDDEAREEFQVLSEVQELCREINHHWFVFHGCMIENYLILFILKYKSY